MTLVSRDVMLQDTVKVLDNHGFRMLVYQQSCLDVAAERKRLRLLMKVLGNIDGFRQEHAQELRRLSACLNACPVLVGGATKTAVLQNNAVYERYGVPSMTLSTFEDALDGAFPETLRSKGREIVCVDGPALQAARTGHGMTRAKLASQIGVTKETVYQYEHGDIRMQKDRAKEVEDMLHSKIIITRSPFEVSDEKAGDVPQDKVQDKLHDFGFSLHQFDKLNFDLIAKDEKNKIIVKEALPRAAGAEKMAQFSEFFKALLAVISEKEAKGIEFPVIPRDEVLSVTSKQDFIRLLREKAA